MIVPAPHPPEFRRRAVELVRRGDRPITVLAKRLRISESCLRRWLAQAEIDENGSDSRLTSAEKRELAQLRRDKRRLERENEILKRTVAELAREKLPSRPDSAALDAEQTLDVLRRCRRPEKRTDCPVGADVHAVSGLLSVVHRVGDHVGAGRPQAMD